MSVHWLRTVRLTRTRTRLPPLHSSRRYLAAPSHKRAVPTDSQAGPSQEASWFTDYQDVRIEFGDVDGQQQPSQEIEKQISSIPPELSRTLQPGAREWLQSLEANGPAPTINDLEKHRPQTHPHPDSPKYVSEYNELVDTLCRTFSKAQLLTFLENSPSIAGKWRRSTKTVYAENIVEKIWGWPSLKELERAKRDRTEVIQQSKFESVATSIDAHSMCC